MGVPPSRRDDVVDVLHGIEVRDPYRWLEEGDSPEVQAWVDAQNSYTRSILERPERAWWHARLVELLQLPVAMAVQVRGEQLVALERPAGAEQAQLTRRSAVERNLAPQVLVDPAAGTADAANAVDWFEISDDGQLIAVGTSEGGTEDSVLRVVDVAEGRDLGEAIPNTRACSVAWEPDGSGFFYTRYPEGDEYHRTVHHHRLGDDWRADPVVWADHPDPQAWPDVALSPDGRWLLVHVLVGWSRYDVHLLDRTTDSWSTVIMGVEVTSTFVFAADGDSLVGVTTLDAPRGRLVRVPLAATDPQTWQTLVAEGDAVLSQPTVTGDEVWVVATKDAADTVRRFAADGTPHGIVDGLPDLIAVTSLDADRASGRAFLVVDSFEATTTVWNASAAAVAEPWFPDVVAGGAVPSMLVSQVEYGSADGTDDRHVPDPS